MSFSREHLRKQAHPELALVVRIDRERLSDMGKPDFHWPLIR